MQGADHRSLPWRVRCGASRRDATQVADGYNAPVSAGNFIDLVSRKFYDGLTIQRADGFIVQTGDPDGPVRVAV